jgi:hypothetical protein
MREHSGTRFPSPALQAWVSIRGIPNQGQVIGDRGGFYPKLLNDSCLISNGTPSSIELDDTFAADALSKILSGVQTKLRSTLGSSTAAFTAEANAWHHEPVCLSRHRRRRQDPMGGA